MTLPTVAVIFGSRSAEHDVSIITAIGSVIKPLRLGGNYRVLPVYITKDGHWYADDRLGDIELYTTDRIDGFVKRKRPVQLSFQSGLELVEPGFGGRRHHIDAVFPATHGTFGEDGSLQGLLRMANVPYVGCGMRASVIAMDKVLTKQILEAHGLPSVKWRAFDKSDYLSEPQAVVKEVRSLRLPLYVKPPRLGSSIGITRVEQASEIEKALEVAFYFDDRVIVEEAVVELTEVTVPIMGNREPRAAMVEEILAEGDDFFDFETKYMHQGKKKGEGKKGSPQTRIPARLPKELYARCEELALATYRAIGGSGTARIDLLIDKKTSRVYVNEVNPLPGFLYAHNWKVAGVTNVELVETLVRLAYERFDEQQKLITSFETSYLRQF
jgi:D-alanine-D-alanine ligase